jgi:KaiC/GvpD/RAD55 family RecA-like ATPase
MSDRVLDDRLSTGIGELDEQILQGIPKGSTVALLADPKSMGNLFFVHLALTGRQTHYVSITRPMQSIQAEMEAANDGKIENLNIYPEYREENNIKANIERFINRMGKEENFIIDNYTQIGVQLNNAKYQKLSRNIYKQTKKNDGITMLLFLTSDVSELDKKEKDVLNTIDGVFQLKTEVSASTREDILYIYKMRGVRDVHDRGVQIITGKRITIDPSRQIG